MAIVKAIKTKMAGRFDAGGEQQTVARNDTQALMVLGQIGFHTTAIGSEQQVDGYTAWFLHWFRCDHGLYRVPSLIGRKRKPLPLHRREKCAEQ